MVPTTGIELRPTDYKSVALPTELSRHRTATEVSNLTPTTLNDGRLFPDEQMAVPLMG